MSEKNKDQEQDQNLGAGNPQLDGEGEYAPPADRQQEESPKAGVSDGTDAATPETVPEGGQIAGNQQPDGTDNDVVHKETIQGQDFEITGNEPIDESDVELPVDGVEYSTPSPPDDDNDPLNEIADGVDSKVEVPADDLEDAVAEPAQEDIPVEEPVAATKESAPSVTDAAIRPKTGINMDKVVEEQELTQSTKPGFDVESTQDAKADGQQEGGIARNRTTGNQFHSNGKPEGTQLRPDQIKKTNYDEMFEVTSFTASFEKVVGQGNVNVEVRDFFNDLETAQASVNGNKYLMPMPQVGYKVVEIVSGAPTISFQERVLYEYINDKWRRK